MWTYSTSIDLNAPAARVYDYLSDLARHADWSSAVRSIELVNGEAGKVGAEYRAEEDKPAKIVSFARITALDAPRRIAWQSTDHRIFRTEWEFLIEPRTDGKTHLTQRVTFYTLSLLARLLLQMRKRQAPAENRASLERIKARLEK